MAEHFVDPRYVRRATPDEFYGTSIGGVSSLVGDWWKDYAQKATAKARAAQERNQRSYQKALQGERAPVIVPQLTIESVPESVERDTEEMGKIMKLQEADRKAGGKVPDEYLQWLRQAQPPAPEALPSAAAATPPPGYYERLAEQRDQYVSSAPEAADAMSTDMADLDQMRRMMELEKGDRRKIEETRGFDPNASQPAISVAAVDPVVTAAMPPDYMLKPKRTAFPSGVEPVDIRARTVAPSMPPSFMLDGGLPANLPVSPDAATPSSPEAPTTRGQWDKVVDFFNNIPREDRPGAPTTRGQLEKAKKFMGEAVDAAGDYIMRPREAGERKEFDPMDAVIGTGDVLQEGMDFILGTDVMGDKSPSIWDLFGGGEDKPATPPAATEALEDGMPPSEGVDAERKRRAAEKAAAPAEDVTSGLDAEIEKYLTGGTEGTFKDALKQIEEAYGGLDQYKNPEQDKADAYMARQGERDQALAMLALAGGMVKGAGKSWEGAGTGFENAAAVYSKGFDRYQSALDSAATRYDTRMQRGQQIEIAKRDAALSMWQTGQTERRAILKDLFTERRQENKDARAALAADDKDKKDRIDAQYGAEYKTLFPSDIGMEPDPAKVAAFMWRWTEALKRGKYVPPETTSVREGA
jgi:hypothetical protein